MKNIFDTMLQKIDKERLDKVLKLIEINKIRFPVAEISKRTGEDKGNIILNGDMYSLMRQLRHTELTTTQIYLKSLGLVDNSAIRNAAW